MASFDLIKLSIVSPSQSLFEGDVNSVQVPGHDGQLGILPGHATLLGLLGYGLLICETPTGTQKFIIDGGFLEVNNNRVVVLANHGERLEDVDVEKARKTLEDETNTSVSGDFDIQARLEKQAAARVRLRYAGHS